MTPQSAIALTGADPAYCRLPTWTQEINISMAVGLDEIESPILRRFFRYYLEKRGSRLFPARADLDPVDFPYALGDITLVNVHRDPLNFSFRLAGGAGDDGVRHYPRPTLLERALPILD